jgi:hypothetical protein
MKVRPDFLNELKAIDPRLDIVDNPNRPELSNIKLEGVDICPIPRNEIRDERDLGYFMIAPNGWKMFHKSRAEAVGTVNEVLNKIKDPEEYEIFFGRAK